MWEVRGKEWLLYHVNGVLLILYFVLTKTYNNSMCGEVLCYKLMIFVVYVPYVVTLLRVALHLEARPIRCARGLKSSLVIGQKVEIGPNPFTPRPIWWYEFF